MAVLVKLTNEEVAARAGELADLHIKIMAIEEERADTASDYRRSLRAMRERLIELSRVVRSKHEERDEQLDLPTPDFKKGRT